MSHALPPNTRVCLVTGASSGIGRATARSLARAGHWVHVAARRHERLLELVDELREIGGDGTAHPLDVTDATTIDRLITAVREQHDRLDVLVNSAGLARGLADVADSDENDWREMLEANVMGLMCMTRRALPLLAHSELADIVHVGSVAGLQPYARGAGYCASKAAVEAFARALRLELVGRPIRQLVIEPGMVNTEFSEVRFHGDKVRADAVYQGLTPLGAEDVADAIAWALSRPAHVSVQTLLLMPTAQAAATVVHRNPAA